MLSFFKISNFFLDPREPRGAPERPDVIRFKTDMCDLFGKLGSCDDPVRGACVFFEGFFAKKKNPQECEQTRKNIKKSSKKQGGALANFFLSPFWSVFFLDSEQKIKK